MAARHLKHLPPSLLAVLAAMLSSILGGSSIVATRYVLPEAGVMATILLRFAGASLLMLAFTLPRRRVRIEARDIPVVVGLGLIQFALFPWLFTQSLGLIPAARAALVLSTQPLITLALSALVGRERFTALKATGGILALAAIGFALGDRIRSENVGAWHGDLYMFGAAVAGSFYNVASGYTLRRYSAQVAASVMIPIGTVAIGIMLLLQGDWSGFGEITLPGWAAVAYLTSFGGVISFFLWIWALERTTPSKVSLAVTLNPVSAALFGALVLAEPVSWRMTVGLVGVITALALVNWSGIVAGARAYQR